MGIVTAKELGKYLRLSESTIYKLAADGQLPGFKIGDSWRFDMEEVVEEVRRKRNGRESQSVRPVEGGQPRR